MIGSRKVAKSHFTHFTACLQAVSLICHFLLEVPRIDSLFLFFHVAGSYSCYLFDVNSYSLEAGLPESWKNKCFLKRSD